MDRQNYWWEGAGILGSTEEHVTGEIQLRSGGHEELENAMEMKTTPSR